MKASPRARRNTSAQLPILPAYPDLQASPQEWEREAKRKRTLERQLITQSKRVNDLCCILRRMDVTIDDLTKRLRFLELAAKLTAGPQ